MKPLTSVAFKSMMKRTRIRNIDANAADSTCILCMLCMYVRVYVIGLNETKDTTHTNLYVCMYVCKYICMYVCMYVISLNETKYTTHTNMYVCK